MRFEHGTRPRGAKYRKRHAVSEIVSTLLLVAVVVSLGVLAFTFASSSLSSLTGGFTGLMTGQGNAVGEHFVVEQATFTTSIGALAIDGTPVTGCFGVATQTSPCSTSTTTDSVTLSTTKSPDVIVVQVSNENAGTGHNVIDPVLTLACTSACTGLSTFSKRSVTTTTGGSAAEVATYQDLEVWYAIASSPLTSAVITVTLTSAADDAVIVAFGVSGANTVSPWDPNISLPAYAIGGSTAASPAPSVTVTTSNANDMILGFVSDGDSVANGGTSETAPGLVAGTSGNMIAYYLDTGGVNDNDGAAEQRVVSTTVSAATVAFGTGMGANVYWLMTGDAIQASPTGADVYVRNVGTIASTLVSVFVVDQTTGTFVGQFPISTTLNVGAYVDIPHTSLTFTPSHGQTYSFTVTSILGNSVKFYAEAT